MLAAMSDATVVARTLSTSQCTRGVVWEEPCAGPSLHSDTVHIWRIRIGDHACGEMRFAQLLDARERARAARFYSPPDRTRYVVSHGALRVLLAQYCEMSPEQLHFNVGGYGKPYLGGAHSQISFNLSHSGDIALVAIARERAVGVDVERRAPDLECLELAEQFFSTAERAELRSLPREDLLAGFFTAWTRKEAYLKATGVGIAFGLDHFDVSLAPTVPPMLRADRRCHQAMGQWAIHDATPCEGYSGAIVAAGLDWKAEFRTFRAELAVFWC